MTDEDALLRSILEEPEDDAPRLVYADWLEEHGQAQRAEFIRVQVELACRNPESAEGQRLKAREAALLKTHAKAWLEALARALDPPALRTLTARVLKRVFFRRWSLPSQQAFKSVKFTRGFVERLAVPAGLFLQSADAIYRAAPCLSELWIPLEPVHDCETLVRSYHAAPLSRLVLYGGPF